MTKGSTDYEFGSKGFYAYPSTHLTNGFFVIVFDRSENDYISSQSSNPVEKQREEPKKKRKAKRPKEDGEKSENATLPDEGVLKLMRAMQKPQVGTSQSEETKRRNKREGSNVDAESGETKKKKKIRKVEEVVEANAEEDQDASASGKRSRKNSMNANGKKKMKGWKVSEKC